MSLPFESNFGKRGEYGIAQSDLIRQVSMRRIDSDQNLSRDNLPRVRNQSYRNDTCFGRFRRRADEFRNFLSTSLCTCFDRIPSVVLFVFGILVVFALVLSIPLAFIALSSKDDSITATNISYSEVPTAEMSTKPNITMPDPITTATETILNEPEPLPFNRSCLASELTNVVQCADGKSHPKKFACSGFLSDCKDSCEKCDDELAFDCGNNQCIYKASVCNGVEDCANGFDEKNCDCSNKTQCRAKTPNGHKKCFSEVQRCDGIEDCPDGEDEENCSSCLNNLIGFYCKDTKKCLVSIKRCDGYIDCLNEEDELDCSCEECQYKEPMYGCSSSKRCFRMNQVCVGQHSTCPNASEDDVLFCKSRDIAKQPLRATPEIPFF